MKYFILIFAFFIISAGTPIKIKPTDRMEYEKYLNYCNFFWTEHQTKIGKIKILKTNGYYTDEAGRYVVSTKADTFWYSPTTNEYTIQYNEKLISIKKLIVVQREIPTDEGFTNWLKQKQNGMARN